MSTPLPPYRHRDLQVDFAGRHVALRGVEVRLTQHEFDLLEYLARNAGKICTLPEIFAAVWGRPLVSQSAYLWTYVHRLREKIEDDARRPAYVLSIGNRGYMLPAPGAEDEPELAAA